ncbi:MAG: alpha amylase N-terminal ig-like domain-containing protein [Bacillota bacterium]
MILSAINHSYNPVQQSVINKNTLELRIETARDDISRVVILYGPRYTEKENPSKIKELNLLYRTSEKDIYSTYLNLDDTRVRYIFYLEDYHKNGYWYNEKGFSINRPRGHHSGYFQFPVINKSDIPDWPDWPKKQVIYQIFPDRFYRSGNDNKAKDSWGDLPTRDSLYGGNLRGIIDKLDYIENMGFTTIYLTPIFKSPSNHKYNIDDYYQIDSNFGNLETAKMLIEEAHKRDIKIILDAVFNHSGSGFFAFQDLIQNGEKSKYINWYHPEKFPVSLDKVNYKTFANNISQMPRLNMDNLATQNYFLEVARYWTEELDLDGWRLDVADEVSSDFWYKFRNELKKINSNIFIIGEVWYRANRWLEGDQFDSVMNYDLQKDIFSLIINKTITADAFSKRIQNNFKNYMHRVPNQLLTVLDSHDTPRISWYFKDLSKSEKEEKVKLISTLQFFLPGIPMVYYGTEIGMSGGDDPDCRRTMIWEKERQNQVLFNHYQRLIKFYKGESVFHDGIYKEIYSDPVKNILVFTLEEKNNKKIIIANFSNKNHDIELDLLEADIVKIIKNKKPEFKLSDFKINIETEKLMITSNNIIAF